jgi:hypothetical protein
MKKPLLVLAGVPWVAFAHDGHGLGGTHWHATDVLGFVGVALVAAAAVWWSGRK